MSGFRLSSSSLGLSIAWVGILLAMELTAAQESVYEAGPPVGLANAAIDETARLADESA